MRSKETQHLARSVLLEESGNPLIIRTVVWFTAIIIVIFVFWAAVTEIDEVTRGQGEIWPVGEVKKIQHVDGGLISEILVQEGAAVKRGQVLLRLDDTVHSTNLAEVKIERKALLTQQSILQEEMEMREDLYRRNLESKSFILGLQRTMSEIEFGLLRTEQEIKKAIHSLELTNITSPESGTIHGLSVHTVGGVIAPGETIAEIVPTERNLQAYIRISPQDIGHVKLKQTVTLKFLAYDYARYGGVLGTLDELSASTFLGEDGKPYYRGTVHLNAPYLSHRGTQHPIIPGMTLTADIRTGKKTVLEYLLKPIYTSAGGALHER